jgi:hypothetical protein
MLGADQQYLDARNDYRIVWVGNEEVDNIATRPLTRDCARVPSSSLTYTIATTFGTGWLWVVPKVTALKIFRDYNLFGQLSPWTLLGRSK